MARITIFLIWQIVFCSVALSQKRTEELLQILNDSSDDYVFVIAHRGDWRNAPENSLQAIQNCIYLGVDMVEIDVRLTKDSVFILMHDDTIDRTTNGTGRVSEINWSELKELRLKDGIGALTNHRIPTLEEALTLTEDKILVNLDKAYDHMVPICNYLKRRGILNQVIFKGWMTDYRTIENHTDLPVDSILFMPIVSLNEVGWEKVIQSYAGSYKPVAFEILFKEEGLEDDAIEMIKSYGSRVWINSLWAIFNAGHDDERAVNDLDGSYGWLIANGATLIQTDRPQLLISYLNSINLR